MGIFNNLKLYAMSFSGFSDESALEWTSCRKACRHFTKENLKLYKKYLWLEPISGKYKKLVDNRLSLRYALEGSKEYLLEYYFQYLKRNGSNVVLPLQDACGIHDIMEMLKIKKKLMVMPSADLYSDSISVMEYDGKNFQINEVAVSEMELRKYMEEIEDTYIVTEVPQTHRYLVDAYKKRFVTMTVLITNEGALSPEIAGAYIDTGGGINSRRPHMFKSDCVKWINTEGISEDGVTVPNWDVVIKGTKEISAELRELQFLGITLIVTKEGFKVVQIHSHPGLPYDYAQHEKIDDFLRDKITQKRKSLRFKRRLFLLGKTVYSRMAEKRGYMGFMMKNWQKDVIRDWLSSKESIKTKMWCHKRGFLSFRKKQYGLTEENYRDFLSDREYRKLRPLNNDFVVWVYDKVITRYILDRMKKYLPEYYYHLMNRGGGKSVIPLQDCPNECSPNTDGILELLRMKGKIVMKPSEGSHGNGFLKLEYIRGQYYVNNDCITAHKLKEKIEDLGTFYNVTEFIELNSMLKEIYDGATYTVRMMVINKSGLEPWLANAYLRIATKSTGLTDNISDGGICARIDMETGEIFQPEKIVNHVIRPCSVHPDSGTEIKGKIPNWEKVKEGVKEVSNYIAQLEYLGFDIVITEESFKILEINTHQDLHRYPHYGESVHRYFRSKQ